MGADIFGSLLNSFNGFPALPIFIGDFLLTQLKQYFYIPLTLASVILMFHYVTKQGSGEFTRIAVRTVTAVSAIYALLSFSMPMDKYISEVLGTNYERVRPVEGGTKLQPEKISLEVFQDIEHFYIIQLMSTFITYSDNIANNLTRKIIYGTTDLNKISKDGTTEMIGYFPALIYNIKDNMSKNASKKAQEGVAGSGATKYFDAKNANNVNFANNEYNKYEKNLCENGISYGFFDSKNRFMKHGLFIWNQDPENGREMADPCQKVIRIKQTKVEDDQLTLSLSNLIANLNEYVVSITPIYNILFEGSLNKNKANGKDSLDYNIEGPYYGYETLNGKGWGGWVGKLKRSDATKNDLYDLIAQHATADKFNEGQTRVAIINANLSHNAGALKEKNKLIDEGLLAPKLKIIQSYFGDNVKDDILYISREFLEKNYQHQLTQLNNVLNADLMKGVLRNDNYTKVNQEDILGFLSFLADSTNNFSTEIKREIQNLSNEDPNRSKTPTITTAVGDMLVKELTTQIYRVMISFITLYDFDRSAALIYEQEGRKWDPSSLMTDYRDSEGDDKVDLYAKKIGYEHSKVWRNVVAQTLDINKKKPHSGLHPLDKTPMNLFSRSGYTRGVSDFTSEIQDRHVVRKLALNEIQMMGATLADLANEFDYTDPYLVARYNYSQQLRAMSALRQYASQAKLGADNGLEKIKTIQGMFDVFNEIRPEGTYPLRAVERPISWVDLGVFYSVFKSTYEQTVRDAFIISETGKRSEAALDNMDRMSVQLSREKMNETGLKIAGSLGAISATADGVLSMIRGAIRDDTTVRTELAESILKGTGTFLKIMMQMVTFVFFINILLPSGIWFIALVNYFIEISLYLAIAPISFMLMIFQVYHMSVQKYINVLIVLLLYPSVLVSLYFIVLFLDMMLPLLIYTFIPFFNDASTVASVVKIAFGGTDGAIGNVSNVIADFIATSAGGATVGSLVAMGMSMMLSLFLSTYLIFMILRAQAILTSMLQGSGMNMVGDGQGFAGEAEQKLKMMGRSGAVVGGMTNIAA